MVLQASGSAIKFSEIQSEFGGTNPISLSEYYIGGDNVPVTISSTTAGTFSAYYGRTPSSKITNSNSSSSFPVTFSGTPSDGNTYYYKAETIARGFVSGGLTLPSFSLEVVWEGQVVSSSTGTVTGATTNGGTLAQTAAFLPTYAANSANEVLITTGGFIYQLGSTVFATDGQSDPGAPNTFSQIINYGLVRRKAQTTTVSSSVNPNVPASGEVSMSDYYGGRDD